MKYLSEQTIIKSFDRLKDKIENKFFGLLGILKVAQSSNIQRNHTYRFTDGDLAMWLDETLYLSESETKYGTSDFYVKFSSAWDNYVSENFFKGNVSVYDVIVFVYKYKAFDTELSHAELLALFCKDYHIEQESINMWFDTTDLDEIVFAENCANKSRLKIQLGLYNDTISFSKPYSVTARAGELTRAPFFQTLYAAMDSLKCLQILNANIDEYYSGSSNDVETIIYNCLQETDYDEEKLGDILKDMYVQGQQDNSQTFRIVLFGLKYGTIIKKNDFKIKQIVEKAGLGKSYTTEVNKGVGLASLISKNANGISFWNEDMQIKVERKRKRSSETTPTINESLKPYLSALRTKPFLLLAGISGTGKSRIVKEMAYESCPDKGDLQSDPITPGNYCLVEVKPNWNDSTELLGYESVLNGGSYHLTPFVKFVVKAMKYPNVPFFVCLDEMNLAPVEQYFAEFLSVLESRKEKNGKIESEALVAADYFVKYEETLRMELGLPNPEDDNAAGYGSMATDSAASYGDLYENLKTKGLRIPQNLIVVGTVNMDDTTYQFSRKVIDRAMTIEMNEVNLDKMFDDSSRAALEYRDEPVSKEWYVAPYAQSSLALESRELANDKGALKEAIYKNFGQTDDNGVPTEQSLEEILGNTPFRVAYRVVNELILHFAALRWEKPEASFEEIFTKAFDNILMMKVLPRIEGNEDLVSEPLKKLFRWTENNGYFQSHRKVGEMLVRLDANHFTSFWP